MTSDAVARRPAPFRWFPAVLCLCATWGLKGAQAPPFDGGLTLILDRALVQQYEEGNSGTPRIRLDLSAEGGRWQPVWGFAEQFNKADHCGRVAAFQADGDTLRLKIAMRIEGDPWIPGGLATYDVSLRRAEDGTLSGAYAGLFHGRYRKSEVRGEVTGEWLPPPPAPPGTFKPVQSGEHPRILFRKHDLEALRAKAATAPGRPLVERLKAAKDQAVPLGMLYQLEGNQAHAARARAAVETMLREGYHMGANNLPEPYGYNVARIAMAYDLCFEAWPDDFRRGIAEHLACMSERLLVRPNTVSSKMNWDPGSNYQPGTRGGAAIATLALLADKGDAPPEPLQPEDDLIPLRPPTDFTLGDGAPIVKFGEASSFRWLVAGPVPSGGSDADLLGEIGGRAAARPGKGAGFKHGGRTYTFEPAAEEVFDCNKYTDNRPALNAKKLVGGLPDTTTYLYAAVEISRAGAFRARAGHLAARLWLAGRPLRDDTFVALEAGRYPLLVQVSAKGVPGGWIQPALIATAQESVEYELARRKAEYEAELVEWREDAQTWKDSGGQDPHRARLARLGRRHMSRYFHFMMGDGGWQAEGEGYTLWSVPLALEYAHAHQMVFGRPASRRPDVTMFAPRYVMQTVFPEGGGAHNQSWGHGGGTLAPRHYARVFSATHQSYQPAVLWAWNHVAGVGGGPEAGDADIPTARADDPMDAVFTLINYPLEMAPRSPNDVMPRTWAATGRGGYIFRNGWHGKESIVAQAFLKTMPPQGWNQPNAGSLRIYGFGREWALKGNMPKSGERMFENVVVLPEHPTYSNAGAFPTWFEAEADGSGAISMDMTPLYMSKKTEKQTEKGRVVEKELEAHGDGQWRIENLKDIGIRGRRSFAADYTGRCGAPALFALADRIEGGGKKVWTWQLPTQGKGKDMRLACDVRVEGRGFTIVQGEKALRVVTSSTRMEWGLKKFAVAALQATGGKEADAGDFLVVMTLQRGDAPKVAITGEGRNATATVGRQTIRFDGDKIVLGEP